MIRPYIPKVLKGFEAGASVLSETLRFYKRNPGYCPVHRALFESQTAIVFFGIKLKFKAI